MVDLSPVVLVGIIVGVLVAIFLGIYLFRKYKEYRAKMKDFNRWPPIYNACPDYWIDLGNGECQNLQNMGRCPQKDGMLEPNGRINFKAIGAIDTSDGRRRLCQKVKECGVTWEHIDTLC